MIRIPLLAAGALAATLATTLHAQNASSCTDTDSRVGSSAHLVNLPGPPARAAEIVDSVLAYHGFTIRSRPADGEWSTAPNFTFVEGLHDERVPPGQNPGLVARIGFRDLRDSTRVTITLGPACAVMRDGRDDGDVAATHLTALNGALLTSAMRQRARVLRPGGLRFAVPADDGAPHALAAPEEAAGFRIVGRYDYEEPADSIRLRYVRGAGRFLDLSLMRGVPRDCDAACARRIGTSLSDAYLASLLEMAGGSYYGRIRVRSDETLPVPAGAPWRYARHVALDIEARGRVEDSHYYLFVYPGYAVKVRATFPPSAEMTAAMQAYLDQVLPTLVPRS